MDNRKQQINSNFTMNISKKNIRRIMYMQATPVALISHFLNQQRKAEERM